MPSYAVLGATGQTGNALLEILMQSEQNQINAYCRSKSKLLGQYPQYASESGLRIFEGSIDDRALLANCCRGVRAVFMAVAVTGNQPGCSIAQDTARSVLSAMQTLRDEKDSKLPTLIMLSSSTTEPYLCRNMPPFARTLLHTALSNIYTDLERAEEFLRSHADWIDAVFIKPGAISHDVQGGHVLSTEKQASPVSFLDVAAGMVETADSGEEYVGKAVSILPKSEKVKIPWDAPLALLTGLLVHFFPWAWRWVG